VRCDRFREALSARLDGEPLGMSAPTLQAHLARCPDCSAWAAAAERVTRRARLGTLDVPDLTAAITAGLILPAARVARRRTLLRAALLVTGAAQLVIGIPALLGDSIGMAMAVHATHEAAAWNLAIGAAFLAAVAVPRRASGLVPLLATFIGVLAVLSVRDVAAGDVSVARLSTHLAVVIGLVLLIGLDRVERALPPGWPSENSERDAGKRGLKGIA
jgi:predicted anti-sigma-YlaC factor YlaD